MDGGELTDSEKYISTLRDNLKNAVTYRSFGEPTYMYPLILTTSEYDPESIRPNLTISYIDGEKNTKLFPTEELEALRPDGTITLSGKTDERIPRYITIEFDRWTDRVTYTEKKSVYETILKGGFALDKSILYLHFGSVNTIYFEYADGKFRIYDDPHEAYFGGEYDAEIVFEYSSAYNEEFVFPDAFIYNLSP